MEALIDKIRTHTFLKDIHPIEWFQDFDPMRTGLITKDQFRRGLQFCELPLGDPDVTILENSYSDQGGVNYWRFVNDITTIFSNNNVEKNPFDTVSDVSAVITRTLGRTRTGVSSEVDSLFRKMAHQIKTLGLHIRESFMDFDRLNSGRVTKARFLRGIPFKNLTEREKDILIERYLDKDSGDISYKKLMQDLVSYQRFMESGVPLPDFTMPHHKNALSPKTFVPDVDTIIQRFAEHVKKNRIRIYEFFKNQDRLNHGRILSDQFKNVLTLFGFSFTSEELTYLSQRYMTTEDFTDYTNYRDFCNEVEIAGEAYSRDFGETPSITQNIILKVRSIISKNRINILPTFQDFDRSKRGYVSKPQFGRVLATLSIMLTPYELQCLIKYYDTDDGVDYFRFVEDVDEEHRQTRREIRDDAMESLRSFYEKGFVTMDVADALIAESKPKLLPKLNEEQTFQSLMAAIQKWAYIHSVYFHEFLEKYDPLNSGMITRNQFRAGVTLAGYRLTEREFELLVQGYGEKDKMKWRKFSEDVKEYVSIHALETHPLVTPVDPNTKTRFCIVKQETPNIFTILSTISTHCASRRMYLRDMFEMKDRHNHKQVNCLQFSQVLNNLGIVLSKVQIDYLCAYYIDPHTNLIKYLKFVDDVNRVARNEFREDIAPEFSTRTIPQNAYNNEAVLSRFKPVTNDYINYDNLIAKIQNFVYKRRIRMGDFFLGFDNLRHGTVHQQKFRTVVGQIGLPLTTPEIDFLIKKFGVPGTTDMFNYRSFVQEANQIYGKTSLIRRPFSVEKDSRFTGEPTWNVTRLSPAQESAVEKVLNRMNHDVKSRRVEVMRPFKMFDENPSKLYITRAQFKEALAQSTLSNSAAEMELLCKAFKCNDHDEINYRGFVRRIGGYTENLDLEPIS